MIEQDQSPSRARTQAPSKRAQDTSECPIEMAIRIIGGKWKPVILWHIKDEKKRFGELKREIPGITVKMLAQQLRELEQDQIIARRMFYEVPPRVEYSMTELGQTLKPILKTLCDWGISYRNSTQGATAEINNGSDRSTNTDAL